MSELTRKGIVFSEQMPENNDFVDHVFTLANGFTPAQCAEIISYGSTLIERDSKVGYEHDPDQDIRRSKQAWIEISGKMGFVFARMQEVIEEVNEHYGFRLGGVLNYFQFTKYDEVGHHYTWHKDIGPGQGKSTRKLTLVAHLSDPQEFSGGQLQVIANSTPTGCACPQGAITIFPSYKLHRVTPMTAGVRYSLIAWAEGPPFA